MKKDDFIKLGLTEEQAAECEKAVNEVYKDFIPKARFDEVNNEKKRLESEVKDRDTQLENLKKASGDNEELKNQIEQLQRDNELIKRDAAIEKALTGAKAKNLTAVKALLKDMDTAEILKDGTLKGLEDQIKTLKKDEGTKFLFEEDKPPTMKGATMGQSGDGTPSKLTKDQFNKMSYKERVELYNSDKDTYDALTSE